MSETEWATKLEYARTIDDPLRRKLYVCALLTEALCPQSQGLPPVVVGGQAVEFYTLGNYATMDVDLVSPRRTEIGNLLESWGFDRVGRHWIREDLDIAIEIPDDVLAGSEDRVTKVTIEDRTVYVISVEDLIVDRLNAYVHWRSTDDGNWAKELMALHGQEIDWEYLETCAQTEGVFEALTTLRNEIEEDAG